MKKILFLAVALSGLAACQKSDFADNYADPSKIATTKRAGTSPNKWPCSDGICRACTAMIPACTRLENTVNQIRLR